MLTQKKLWRGDKKKLRRGDNVDKKNYKEGRHC